jgi:hypothetical protein
MRSLLPYDAKTLDEALRRAYETATMSLCEMPFPLLAHSFPPVRPRSEVRSSPLHDVLQLSMD